MKPVVYSKEYHIESTHVDTNKKLSLPAFFLLFQDLAIEHAELLGVGKKNTIDRGFLWVFTSVKFEFYKMPNYLDSVIMYTYPGDRRSFLFDRYVYLKDKEGNILAKGSTTWALINSETRRLIVRPDVNELVEHHEDDELSLPSKLSIDEELSLCYERDILYCDCDLNSHLNNTRYIELIVNIHNLDFYKENKINSIEINYLKEIRDGQHIKIYTNKNKTYVRGVCNDVVCFDARLSYELVRH